MDRRSVDTISEVGNIYMSGMNERIVLHFATTIEMRLSHVEDMERLIESGKYTDGRELRGRVGIQCPEGDLSIWHFIPKTGSLRCYTVSRWRWQIRSPSLIR